MRLAIATAVLLSSSAFPVQAQTLGSVPAGPLPVSEAPPNTEIVVTARRDAADALAKCLARKCPPVEDISASLAVAEQEFLLGDYLGARRVLASAVDRNKGFASTHPRAVATLYDVHARIAHHYGDVERFRRSTFRRAEVLKDGLQDSDPERLRASAHVGDMLATLGKYREADRHYASAGRTARKAGQAKMEFAMNLRRAWLHHARGDSGIARRDLRALAASTQEADLRLVTSILLARLARDLGEPDAITGLIAEIARQKAGTPPTLLFEPPIGSIGPAGSDRDAGSLPAATAAERRSSDYGSLLWVDIGFWLRPDGRVEDAEILRGTRATGWARPVVMAIAGRRYAPFEAEAGAPGQYRLERYTYTTDIVPVTGSYIKRRAGPVRLRRQDITRTLPTETAQRE